MHQSDINTYLKELQARKIFILAWRDLDDLEAGGSELYIHKLATSWASLGLDVTLRTSVAAGRPTYLLRDGYKVIRKAGRYMVFPRSILSSFIKLDPRRYFVLEAWNGMPFFTPLWFNGPKLAIIHHVHAEMWQMALPPYLATIGNVIEEKIAPLFYRNSAVVTASNSSKSEIVSRLKIPEHTVTVVKPGVDQVFRPKGKKSERPLVLGVGRLVPVKQFSLFLDVVLRVKKTIKNLEVIIAGDGYERDKLQELIYGYNASSWIKLVGKVNLEQLIRLYSKAWVYLTTSKREGWNLTVSEAMACGTPVVATRIVGHVDNVIDGYTGYLADDLDGLVEKVTLLLENSGLRAEFQAQALQISKDRRWDMTSNEVLKVMAKVIAQRR